MKWWPLVGLGKMITERNTKEDYVSSIEVKKLSVFKRSMHVYTIDVGNDNTLNFEISALRTPRYNVHRFGIYFAASPRHADLLIVLGKPTKKMVKPLVETLRQLPEPFGVLWIKGCDGTGEEFKLPNVVAVMEGCPTAREILAVLLKISGRVD